MNGRDSRGNNSAPGAQLGADAFAHDGARAKVSGIVSLSDLVGAPTSFPVSTASLSPTSPVSCAATGPKKPRARGEAISTRHSASPFDTEAAAEQTDQKSGRCAEALVPSSGPVEHSDSSESDADLVPYESLFGSGGDANRRPRRPAKPPATAAQRAIGLLSRREHSRKELTTKLVTRGLDPSEVEAAVAKLANAGWQDDRRFAESLVRARAAIGYGPLRIRAELGTHGLAPGIGEAALDAFEGDWTEIARDSVIRRFGRIEDARVRQRKAADYLIRRGFPSYIAFPASRAERSA